MAVMGLDTPLSHVLTENKNLFRAFFTTANIMLAKVITALLLVLVAVQAFVPAATSSSLSLQHRVSSSSRLAKAAAVSSSRVSGGTSTALRMAAAEGDGFWEGEWVCADCGYIYDRDDCGGLAFEQQVRLVYTARSLMAHLAI